MDGMKLPVGTIAGNELEALFSKSIEYHIGIIRETLEPYDPVKLFKQWNLLVRSIDEIINIPLEFEGQSETEQFLSLNFDFLESSNLLQFQKVLDTITKQFDTKTAERFRNLALMSNAICKSYKITGAQYILSGITQSTTTNSITYYQSRRAYYVSMLSIIPEYSKGTQTIPYLDLLNCFQYTLIDTCSIAITTAYFNLFLNQCLPDFEMHSNGTIASRNFDFDHLEGFFFEPERLSLLDQMELRPDQISTGSALTKPKNQVFSFSEVAGAMSLFEGAFKKYKINETQEFKDLNLFFYEIGQFVIDDFNIEIDTSSFERLKSKYSQLTLSLDSSNYFDHLNSYAPFQHSGTSYYSTVVLLTKFVYRTLSAKLLTNRTFQINSGFVFEDRVSEILKAHGFYLTGISRINRKEFDVITIKDGIVHNFQCKNNFLDISKINLAYKKLGRLNRMLCRYYERALVKEEKREKLITSKTGINTIKHYVISRYPVVTRNERIINFNNLENTLRIRHK